MSYSVELQDVSAVEKDLKVSIERVAFDSKFQKELSKITGQVQMKGYRPGRAPKAMVAKMYGERLESDVVQEFVQQAVKETIDSKGLSLIDVSPFKVNKETNDGPIEVNLQLSLYPEINLNIDNPLTGEVSIREYSEELLNKQLESVRIMFAELKEATDTDIVDQYSVLKCTYDTFVDGEKKDQMSLVEQDVDLSRPNSFPEEIKSQVIGMKAGEEKEISFTFPEDAVEDLKGKTAKINFSLKSFRLRVLPAADDEFAKLLGKYETIGEFKTFLESTIKAEIEKGNMQSRNDALLKAVSDASTVVIPQVLIDDEIRQILVRRKIVDAKDKNASKMPVEGLRGVLGEEAQERIKMGLVYNKLQEKFDIKVEESDIDTMLESFQELFGEKKEDLLASMKQKDLDSQASDWLLFNKLAETVTLTEKIVTDFNL